MYISFRAQCFDKQLEWVEVVWERIRQGGLLPGWDERKILVLWNGFLHEEKYINLLLLFLSELVCRNSILPQDHDKFSF